jgi:predicted tellurium resistance membrane protein TerC
MNTEIAISVLSLTGMEIVLGIDNLIFISILCAKLPQHKQRKARQIGIALAVLLRILLLFAISWLIGLQKPLISIGTLDFTGKDIILFIGGAFLTVKTLLEIRHKIMPENKSNTTVKKVAVSVAAVIAQIVVIDLIFSIDSILTAVGLVDNVWIMVMAVLASTLMMVLLAEPINGFIEKYPGFKLMALLFLIIIGSFLILESFHFEVLKGYLYFSMMFGLVYEFIHIKYRAANEK